ncbi:MAG TPA: Crp/Fnr family transcriptional regulator [Chloroflexota bacterium]|nr:Crp/Fnr family transcriptional regulator [Chloroflexota bacterium]
MTTDLDLDALARSVVLRGLQREELEHLARTMRRRSYRRGEVVFHQGDPGESLHVVCHGKLKVVIIGDNGEEAVLAILGPSDVFGEMAVLDGGPRSATVTALEPVETAVLSRADFIQLLRRMPSAVDGLLASLAQTIRQADEDIGGLMFLDLHGRLARKLLELADTYGEPSDGSTLIRVQLTQEELAGMIGATRASVNKILGYFEDRGAIQRHGRQIVVCKPDILERRATA